LPQISAEKSRAAPVVEKNKFSKEKLDEHTLEFKDTLSLFIKYPKSPLQKFPEISKVSFGEYEFTNLLLQSKILPLLKENKLNNPDSPDIAMADLPEELEI
jgi:hypothetical protein